MKDISSGGPTSKAIQGTFKSDSSGGKAWLSGGLHRLFRQMIPKEKAPNMDRELDWFLPYRQTGNSNRRLLLLAAAPYVNAEGKDNRLHRSRGSQKVERSGMHKHLANWA